MFNNGFNSGYGASGIYNYKKGVKHCWHFKKLDFGSQEKSQRFCKEVRSDVNFKSLDIRESSQIYRRASVKKTALEFDESYTKEKEKRIPDNISNESIENRKWF